MPHYLDCGCYFDADNHRHWCPTCANPPHEPSEAPREGGSTPLLDAQGRIMPLSDIERTMFKLRQSIFHDEYDGSTELLTQLETLLGLTDDPLPPPPGPTPIDRIATALEALAEQARGKRYCPECQTWYYLNPQALTCTPCAQANQHMWLTPAGWNPCLVCGHGCYTNPRYDLRICDECQHAGYHQCAECHTAWITPDQLYCTPCAQANAAAKGPCTEEAGWHKCPVCGHRPDHWRMLDPQTPICAECDEAGYHQCAECHTTWIAPDQLYCTPCAERLDQELNRCAEWNDSQPTLNPEPRTL